MIEHQLIMVQEKARTKIKGVKKGRVSYLVDKNKDNLRFVR